MCSQSKIWRGDYLSYRYQTLIKLKRKASQLNFFCRYQQKEQILEGLNVHAGVLALANKSKHLHLYGEFDARPAWQGCRTTLSDSTSNSTQLAMNNGG